MVNRKSTKTSSSLVKYASDCYVLHQFISGDSASEINNVFKSNKQGNSNYNLCSFSTGTPDRTLRSSIKGQVDLLCSELHAVKDTVSNIASEFHVFEASVKADVNCIRDENKRLKQDVARLSDVLDVCKSKIENTFYFKDVKCENNLPGRLHFISTKVVSLEQHKYNVSAELVDLSRRVDDASVGLSNLNDNKVSVSRGIKLDIKDLSDRITVLDDSIAKHDRTLVGMDNSIRYLKEDRKSTRLNSQSRQYLVCRLLLEKKKKKTNLLPRH